MLKHRFLYLSIALLAFETAAVAQTKPQPSPRNRPRPEVLAGSLVPADPAVLIGKLPNGLTYYIRKNTEPKNRADLYLVNKAGSVQENDDQQGLAHFVEHMAFNGTRDYPKNELVNFLQKSGIKFGADLNAYTSFDQTVYQLPMPTDSAKLFAKGFDILANWAGMDTFDNSEIDKERGVVLEEERLRGKNAQERIQLQTLPVILNNSRYAQRLPIGKEDILKNFKSQTIKNFYKDWYRPDLQAVVAVGDFDPKQVLQLIKQNFSELKNPAKEKPFVKYEIPVHKQILVKIVTDKEQPYTIAQIIVKRPGTVVKNTMDLLENLRISLFNSMINARISELTQQSNPPFLFAQSSYSDFLADLEAFSSIVVTKPGELEKGVKAIVAENERVQKFGFTQTELDRAKQSVMATLNQQFNEKDKTRSSVFVNQYQQNFLKGDAIPSIDFKHDFYQKNIGQITLSEINGLTKKFISDENRVVIVQAPEKEKANLPNEKTLLNWISTAGEGVKAYVDEVSNKPLLEKVPTGSKTVSEKKNTAINSTELTLGNGVKVVLKPTDFKNDQILINSFSFGGTSLASNADYTSANFADEIVGSSGVGSFTQIQLDKMLAGKIANVSPYISATAQGFSGSASPKDLETALQLVYLYSTSPRKDANIWNSNLSQYKTVIASRSSVPESVFQDTVAAVMSSYNLRGSTPTLKQLDAASLDKTFAFYQQRFADHGHDVFTLVGNFDPEKIKPLLEKYLGALPATGTNASFKDLNIHAPAGKITKTVYKGLEAKSSVQLVFTGDYKYSEANNLQLDALEEILNIKMIERLREKESGVYAPRVNASYTKIPEQRFNVTVSFGCAPENVNKLITAALEEIDLIKKNGAETTDIQKFVAEESRSTELQLKNNGFWLGQISKSYQYQQDPADVLEHVKNLNQITVQSTKATASQYLSGDNLIRFILLPEKK
ncbi:M16 family metallopeptidase [uncultured Mucilaginibacter sp.]|uniref:M16 family metallopeptidase n=1 Tax=uncultured Mucilaginibacter sp. TaxID=797541 RepID=UPI00263583DA|nr:M16 family metallopeptidase [uncultured Mucilaginibacter sp.]